MVGESKILTVSYGTFSCTLEGFDDSFSTMKAIAEYFKGLAAEDRYFGAEPPAPDAEMLMRIAEREVKSRVEAQVGEGGIVLRRSEGQSDSPQEIHDAAEPHAAPTPPEAVEQTSNATIVDTPAPRAAPSPFTAPEGGDSDSVAAKLSRIRAVVSRAPNAAASHDTEDDDSNGLMDPIESAFKDITQEAAAPAPKETAEKEAAQPEHAQPEIAPTDFDAPADEASADEATDEITDEITDAIVETPEEAAVEQAPEAEAPTAENTAEETTEETTDVRASEIPEEDATEDDGVLAGVGAFMAQSDSSDLQADEEGYSNEQGDTPIDATDISSILGAISNEAETSEDAPADTSESAAEAEDADAVDFSAITEAFAEDEDEGAATETELEAEEEPEIVAVIEDAPAEETSDELVDLSEPSDEISQDDIDDLGRMDGTDISDGEITEEAPEEAAHTDDEIVDAAPEGETTAEEAPHPEDGSRVAKPSISSVAARARARVIRVKKADLADAIEGDSGAELVDTGDAAQHVESTTYDMEEHAASTSEVTSDKSESDAALSDEDEADLMAQLAAAVDGDAAEATPAIEAQEQTASDENDADDDALDRAIGAAIGDVHAPLPEVTPHQTLAKEADDEKMNRLMEESESQFAESEGSRRRSAIAHLKAAVAATVADRKILGGSAPSADDTTTDYRKDLADVVRPSRAKRLLGKKDSRPAPLMLVSEQRIDAPDGTAVQPRRVGKSAVGLHDVNEGRNAGSNLDEKSAKHLAESKSFAEFAERVGATELPDLLEAAAAYTAFVEGLEHFTRPQVMRRVLRFSEDQGVTREEGLRSFGLLLRQGKIEKVKRGQFKISESTRFRPDARIAGE